MKPHILAEAGTSGLKHYSGYVREEWHPKLEGRRGAAIYREMSDNDAAIGGALLAIETLIRGVEFDTDPADETDEAHAEAEFLWQCMNDMEATWNDFVAEAMTMIVYGWSLFEEVYKVRRGEHETLPQVHSNHDDGRIGWRNLAPRPQDSLHTWDIDKNGRTIAMLQAPQTDYKLRRIDMNRAVLFRPTSRKNNPEGRSLLRPAYRSWFFLKKIQEIEAIGVERDLAGYPVFEVPAEMLASDADAATKARVATFQKMVERIRRDQYEGSVIPSEQDTQGNPTGYRLRLLSSGGRRPIDVNEIVKRYESRILISLLAEFLILGMDKVGSFALSSDKTDLFANALGALLDSFCETMNRTAIPRLFRLNGVDLALMPKLKHGDIEKENIAATVQSLTALAGAGLVSVDDELESHVRELIGAPKKRDDAEPLAPAPAPPPLAVAT